ncbi:saccharopine dehydrogenase, partial [Pseudomonas sp. FW305-130]
NLTTAGPFALYGDPLVDACVRLGTHYVDISGEPARIRGLIDRYHRDAKAAGVRIVNFCAFSSTPSDLGVYLLNKALGGDLREATGYFRLGGGAFSGGTIASISLAHDT